MPFKIKVIRGICILDFMPPGIGFAGKIYNIFNEGLGTRFCDCIGKKQGIKEGLGRQNDLILLYIPGIFS